MKFKIALTASASIVAIATMALVGNSEKQAEGTNPIKPERGEMSERLYSLTVESIGTTPKEKIMIASRLENGVRIAITNKTMVSKVIRIDPPLKEVAEYVQIALTRARQSMKIPDGVVPIVEIQGEWMIITFPWLPPDGSGTWEGPDYYAKVTMETKTKVVLKVLVAP